MYTQFFNLKQAPFSIAPDPRYLFMSERHREALAHLLYGVGSGGGFVLLTGEIGAGKTTVCRCFLEQIPDNCKVAYIFNPKLSVEELLHSICDEFGLVIDPSSIHSIKAHVDMLNAYLLAAHAEGKNNVLIIDEAQNLSPEVLEQLRLLTNLETSERKLLQIILIGQPELRTILTKPELEQLAQRVIARYHLGPLSIAETGRYILHRLGVAGLTTVSPLPPQLMKQIQHFTDGVPRRINLLCDRALLGAYSEDKRQVDSGVIKKAAQEVFGKDAVAVVASGMPAWYFVLLGLLVGVLVTGLVAWRLVKTNVAPSSAPALVGGASTVARASAVASVSASAGTAKVSATTSAPNSTPALLALASAPAPADAPRNVREAEAAYSELGLLWGLSLPDIDPCQAAQKKNLRCYSGNGGLSELLQLDRPAVLTLRNDAQATYYALLVSLDNNFAVLRSGGKSSTMSLSALDARFQGEFMTFWKVPKHFRDVVVVGNRGADVDWVAAKLAAVNGLKSPVENQPFDQQLSRQVKDFQSAQKLKIDAAVGPRTFMRLNFVSGIGEPRLLGTAPAANTAPQK